MAMDDFLKRMAELEAAEAMLSCASLRGIASDFRTQMDLNRMILDGARAALEQPAEPAPAPGEQG
ncbi:MAG TPA: hypothetical protein VGE72_16490 [Azospirillum sp.]